jgi:hypothetical protein
MNPRDPKAVKRIAVYKSDGCRARVGPNPEPAMASDPGPLRIRNQRYPRWVVVAENGFVAGTLVAFLLVESLGLWLLGLRTTMYALLACLIAILPVVLRGWLVIWDLSRPGPGQGVTARALYEGVVLGVRRRALPAAIEWTALTAVRALLPSVHTVSQLKLGDEVEVYSAVRFPSGSVSRVQFAPEPDDEYKEPELPLRLYEATVEVHSGRRFRLIVDQADAERFRQWADTKGIAVCDSGEYGPRTTGPVSEVPVIE